jgi:Protein of unknown function (DUF3011)
MDASMKRLLFLSCFMTMGVLADIAMSPAAAQGRRTVTCESSGNRFTQCPAPWHDARVDRELSSTRCVRGRNWDIHGRNIWVNGGCRATFVASGNDGRERFGGSDGHRPVGDSRRRSRDSGRGGRIVACGSSDNRYRRCDTYVDRGDRVRLMVNDSSTRCVEGRNWGVLRHSIWVDRGCRGRFLVGGR